MKIRMLRDYTYEIDKATSRTFHRGQVLSEEDRKVADAAVKAGAAEVVSERKAPPKKEGA